MACHLYCFCCHLISAANCAPHETDIATAGLAISKPLPDSVLDSEAGLLGDMDVTTTCRAPYFSPSPPRQNSNGPFEPVVFNDDEALDLQSSSNNTSDTTTDGSSLEKLLMKTYTEVPAVPRLTVVDDFTVLVHLKAPTSTVNQNSRAPIDLVTVTTGTKLALLKRVMGFVIQNLGPADRLSVIAFSSTACHLFPLRKMSMTGKQHAFQDVNSLVAQGATNIAEGLRMSGKVMEDRREKNPVAGILLFSDGKDTYGMSSSLVSGIQFPIYSFGFGADHDARGTFSFIENENVIQDAFAQCIAGLLSVVVKGLQVTVESANPNILLRSLKAGSYKNQLMPDRKSGCVDFGDLYADEEWDFLVSVNIPEEMVFRPENIVSVQVDKQRNQLQSAEAMEQARKATEEGDLRRAVSILENFRKVLSETISAKLGDHLCMALDVELKELQDKMTSRHTYEHSGRANVLSVLSSHQSQRAAAYGGNFECGGTFDAIGACGANYQTPAMAAMIKQSQTDSGFKKLIKIFTRKK
uniref:E3 ubiquitin-protein ligase WAV3-like n=1 Tax=Erigeron canadensis TaxID=72917 RepID=UPI001CB98313|nr:E3 ubiquitin-protein ligase WAV3-like [Erigeron canadensis]